MSHAWTVGPLDDIWWVDGYVTGIWLRRGKYYVTDDRLDIDVDEIAGPFDTLDEAKAVYLLIGETR